MNATFDCRLTVSRFPIAHKTAGFNPPVLGGVCQFDGTTRGHHALKADLEGLERQYLTLVEFVIPFFSSAIFLSLDDNAPASTGTSSSGDTIWVNLSKRWPSTERGMSCRNR